MKLSPDQVEFQAQLRRFFSEQVAGEYVRAFVNSRKRHDEKLVGLIRELGLFEGFIGDSKVFGIDELGIVAVESGRALLPLALTERLLVDGILPDVMTPTERTRFDTDFKASQSTVAPNACSALSLHEGADRVDGHVSWCAGCEEAERIIAFADTNLGRRCVVFRLKETGVRVIPVESLDMTLPLSRVECASVPVLVLGEQTTGAIEDLLEALKASEASGICERVLDMSVDYAKAREQFGKPIGSFQAIQHKLADAYALSESLGSLARFAIWAASTAPDQRHLTARAAVSMAADVCPKVCETAIQCHGGIGFTWEYDLHLYLRRAKTVQAAYSLTASRVDELLRAAI